MILTHGCDPSQVALTFDDGPNFEHTLSIINALEKHGAKGTFFLIGKWVKEFSFPTMKDMVIGGHEIGNHTMTHRPLGDLPLREVENEIAQAQQAIIEACGVAPTLLRPPYGNSPQLVEQLLIPTGMRVAMWSQMSGDWAAQSTEEIVSKINLETDKGEIVLLHDGGPSEMAADRHHTVEAVEIILEKYSGIKKFVTVSELTL